MAAMRDEDCVRFLQWSLPKMGLRWAGYRRVRRTVRKRLRRRMGELGLGSLESYRAYLEGTPSEWESLEACYRIPISRFFRDRDVFERLALDILPDLAEAAREQGDTALRAWCAGAASGEEPYSLTLLWRLRLADTYPDLALQLLATDAEASMLTRARRGCYSAGSFKDLPRGWRDLAFTRRDEAYCVREEFRAGVTLRRQDIRQRMPAGPFALILCRNLAFTYFAEDVQLRVLTGLVRRLAAGGALIIGGHEHLPAGATGLTQAVGAAPIYRRTS